jgi:hypothetical protein
MIKSTFGEEYCRVYSKSTSLQSTIQRIHDHLGLSAVALSFVEKAVIVKRTADIMICTRMDSRLVDRCGDIAS